MATTYYVDGAVGNNTNVGTSEGAGNAWATVHWACTHCAAGDTIYVKASATYAEAVTPSVAGTTAAFISLIGYTSTPGDGGTATITGSSARADGFISIRDYWYYENIDVIDCLDNGWEGASCDYSTWVNCGAHDNGGTGFFLGQRNNFHRCSATGNGEFGLRCAAECNVTGGVYTNNYLYNVYSTAGNTRVTFCLVVGGLSAGIYLTNGGLVENCTIDGLNVVYSGIAFGANALTCMVLNNIIYDCAGGIRRGSATYQANMMGAFNLMNSNVADYEYWPAHAQTTDITGSVPGFTNEAGGDYTLAAGSAARNAAGDASGAASGLDCGCYQSEDSGSSTGRVVLTS